MAMSSRRIAAVCSLLFFLLLLELHADLLGTSKYTAGMSETMLGRDRYSKPVSAWMPAIIRENPKEVRSRPGRRTCPRSHSNSSMLSPSWGIAGLRDGRLHDGRLRASGVRVRFRDGCDGNPPHGSAGD